MTCANCAANIERNVRKLGGVIDASVNFASEVWCCPNAEMDCSVGGKFDYRMQVRDGSVGLDLECDFTSE